MNVNDGTLAVRGHRNHMQALNYVFNAGSISQMVKKKMLKKGIMYECIKKKIPFVLAGSLRDDGPIPDVIEDVIRLGFIDALLAGNALAVHDIEYATLGTSLGMNVNDGTLAVRGHRNHMQALNYVFNAGSISQMVKKKMLKKGIMYECIKKKIPFVLAGSLRDDGPIPDVIEDVILAQKKYKEVLKDAKLVIMIATMLHSIATGNMLPADVKIIVVDINQATVTKLMDRGTWQALGIVSDVGAFVPLVLQEIKKLTK